MHRAGRAGADPAGPRGVRARPLFRLILLFLGLAVFFAGLNLAARGHPAGAAAAWAAGGTAAAVAARALVRGVGDRGRGNGDPDADARSGPEPPGRG